MAERRMFAKTIVTSDAFLDMPASARCLYFMLGMVADDDGFVNAPRSIMRQAGSSQDDMNLLIAKRFVLTFQSGVVVIKHWKIHNVIQKDRYKSTKYLEEKAQLTLDQNNAYTEADKPMYPECIQNVSKMETQDRIGKDRIGNVSLGESGAEATGKAHARFEIPSLEDIKAYCTERRSSVNAERFFAYYNANGWHIGKTPMEDWRAAVVAWETNGYSNNTPAKKEVPKGASGVLGAAELEAIQEIIVDQ